MSLQAIPLAEIKEADLQSLLTDGARESRAIDYKQAWSLTSDSEKREFLNDVASFVNAGGGDLVYGVSEKDGVPLELLGLDPLAIDTEQLRADNVLRAGISPRLAGIEYRSVPLASGKIVWILRIRRSFAAPHMANGRFYSRASNGKFQLDVTQLRSAFLESAGAADRLRDFRLDRVSRIASGEIGVKLLGPAYFVWHLMPLAELAGIDQKKVIELQTAQGAAIAPLRPMGPIHGWSPSFNFNGMMVTATALVAGIPSYVQVFRNGAIEAGVSLSTLARPRLIPSGFEAALREGLEWYLGAVPRLGITAPYFVALSAINVGGFTMGVRNPFTQVSPDQVIDRPNLLLPAVAVETAPPSVDALTKPAFDMIWNACGYDRSPNFDAQGHWKPAS